MFDAARASPPMTDFDQLYPQRQDDFADGLIARAGQALLGGVQRRLRARRRRVLAVVAQVERHATTMQALSAEGLRTQALELTRQLRRNGLQDTLVVQCFALVREAADRVLGMRHFDVQLIGGWVMLRGMVAEMETGEGKTLTATLAACTAALAGRPVHIITVNDYLVARDHAQMQPLYSALGISSAAVTAEMSHEERQRAYACDVVYCTNKTVVFDYLRDRIVLGSRSDTVHLKLEKTYARDTRVRRLLLRGLSFAIVDEADSVLADEAGTPLIISAEVKSRGDTQVPEQALAFARQLEEGEHYRVMRSERRIVMLEAGHQRVLDLCQALGGVWRITLRREDMLLQALSALHLYIRDEHYLVRDGTVQVIDAFTGRVMADRSWGQGLHQMIEVKEGCARTPRRETLARISYQRFFRRYQHLSGMSGTVAEVAPELAHIYDLAVFRVPTHLPSRRSQLPDQVCATQAQKWQTIVQRVQAHHARGAPVLVGTRSVAASELLSEMLHQSGLPHTVLNAKQDSAEADVVAQAGQPGRVTIATNMAGRGTDIKLSPEALAQGGLHVIVSERNEAGRIDRQLAGRCARQGDPGCVEAVLALDDPLLLPMRGLLAGLLLRAAEALGGRWRDTLQAGWIRRVQSGIERRQSRMRLDLIKADRQTGDMLSFSGRAE